MWLKHRFSSQFAQALSLAILSLLGLSANAESSVQLYEPDYFMAFQPSNALDVLDRVPSAKAVLDKADGGGRGFNANSQLVLINGQPISAKSNSVSSVLARITADSIQAVELIRGGVPGLNVSSSETVVNIQLSDEQRLSTSWEARLIGYEEDDLSKRGNLFFNWRKGESSLIAGLETATRAAPEFYRESLFDTSGQLGRKRQETTWQDGGNSKLTSTYNWAGEASALQFNGLYEQFNNQLDKRRQQSLVSSDSEILDQLRVSEEQDKGYQWEYGVDYETRLGSNNAAQPDKIKWQWIQSHLASDFDRVIVDSSYQVPGDNALSLEDKNKQQGETIAKATLFSHHSNTFSSRGGVELVYNYLDQQLQLDENGVTVEDSDQRIAEERAEASWFGKWQLPHALNLEAGSAVEYSKVRQSGDSRQSTNFNYIKPSLELNWRGNHNDSLLMAIKRSVSQLNLGDFANTVDSSQDEVRVANPNLEPQKAWEFSAQYERVLAKGLGNFNLQYFYHWLEDVVDQTPVAANESVLGNIGDGELSGIKLDMDIQLAENTQGNINMLLQQSEVTDPFTGEQRRLRDTRDRQMTFELRQQLHALPASLGIIYYYKGDYQNRRVDEINRVSESKGYLDTYLEWNLPGSVNMRLDVKNILDNAIETNRNNYQVSIGDGVLESTEQLERRIGLFWEFSITGQI